MLNMFQAGGPVMWPLLLCSIASLTIILERAFFWLRSDIAGDRAGLEAILSAARRNQETAIFSGSSASIALPDARGAVAKMLLQGLAQGDSACAKAMENAAMEEVREMRSGMVVLDTVITAAPMLGILGTVLGIISSFDMLGASGVEDPKAVVSGIAEALITTAAGLVISVTTVFPYNYFNSRIENAQDLFESYGTRLEMLLAKDAGSAP